MSVTLETTKNLDTNLIPPTSKKSNILTRGQKRATETYDFMFNIIEEKDLFTLFGVDCMGPNEQELRVYFKVFPKKAIDVITKQDLIDFINKNYTSDQAQSINVDEILEKVDLDQSGEIEIEDFVEYINDSIIEKSKDMGLIIELSSEEEEVPKKKRKTNKKSTPQTPQVKKTTLNSIKKEKLGKTKKQKVQKEKKVTPIKKTKKTTKTSKVKYNFEKYHNDTNKETNSQPLESGGLNNQNENKMFLWKYEFNNKWLNYTDDASQVVEDAYQEWLTNPHIDVRSVQSGQWAYQIDFKQMTQTNIQHIDHTSRNIKRTVTFRKK
ncbi:hypothetical protein DICPUDRAFT_77505 [Dictyostelium purpureum]|uniref:WWE domain-containing protein n=1 Tax=Dictyostelium purpureum TaxID=5786 RepID=F0ZGT3_DICPU|nr:uncharacterized protein DICPUDRAFT_77505 [Dictyostelium purpureum]EGC36827.1 hypothetical protein DICPUDRAFT_77505 [Dictyostelium purpureum]|eukprot:XP_003286625.1 hypothetical protein DICPUDRAFT_77505 [Dictyostelium purpureum]